MRYAAPIFATILLAGCQTPDGGTNWTKIGAASAAGVGVLIAAGPTASALAGGAVTGAAATFVAVNTDADTALKVVKPLNQALCLIHPWNPKSDEAEAAIAAFCAHLPDTTAGLLTQGFAIIQAIDDAHSAPGKSP